ncbi:flagellar basal body-associated FliL family protein [Pontibaca salina]|uniref:Flagellar protein FliL n=1 Tax=Pontibaca salina TaxID=2795731 RepID=A0A934LXR0_9RHOB|nr:flagellar basal body-associated FliL family protein [Pontibaca salina]MBI6628917.1 flagellar basal body-associated FliL family protein [Pontibaca salina]
MTDAATEAPAKRSKNRKRGLALTLLLSAIGAAAGYYGVSSGVIPITALSNQRPFAAKATDIAFVEIDPIMISFSGGQSIRQLRFRAQLEVDPAVIRKVQSLLPRVIDVLNGYLRALQLADLTDPLALTRLRGQMLRRVQVVVGRENVRDLLIMEFVLN